MNEASIFPRTRYFACRSFVGSGEVFGVHPRSRRSLAFALLPTLQPDLDLLLAAQSVSVNGSLSFAFLTGEMYGEMASIRLATLFLALFLYFLGPLLRR